MIKEEKIMKEDIKYRKFCDICGDEVTIGLLCCKAQCAICGRDLCEKCIGYEDTIWGDYRTVYCSDCWSTGEKYREKIEELESEVDQLHDKWYKECEKNKIKK